jgi:hypothetical protein
MESFFSLRYAWGSRVRRPKQKGNPDVRSSNGPIPPPTPRTGRLTPCNKAIMTTFAARPPSEPTYFSSTPNDNILK